MGSLYWCTDWFQVQSEFIILVYWLVSGMGSLYWCTGWFQVQNGFIILVYWLVSGTEWVDPEDPTVIAENELLGAAAAIEAAAKKLEQLRPRTKPKVTPPSSS